MRNKYLLLSLLVAATGSLFAQSSLPQATPTAPELVNEISPINGAERYYDDDPVIDTNLATMVWESDFSNSNDWTTSSVNGSGTGWTITNTVDVWAFNSFSSTSGGNFAQMDNGNPNGTVAAGEHTLQMAHAADVSTTTGGAYVEFQQLTARFFDAYFIEASNDGTTWSVIGLNDHVHPRTAGNNTPATSNPEHSAYYIPASIAGSGADSLWVRWRWVDDNNGIMYGWMVDDVKIFIDVDNDLDLFLAFNGKDANGNVDSNSTLHYTQIPLKQAEASDFRPAAAIASNGNVTQTDVTLTATESNSSYSNTTAATQLANGEFAVVQTGADLALAGTGNYSVTFTANSSGNDAIDANNTATWNFNVNQNTYAYDDEEPQGASWFGDGGYSQCLYFDNFTDDTIIGIEAYFPQADFTTGTFGLKYGQTIGAYIYANESPFGGTELASAPFYEIDYGTEGQIIDDWVTIPLEYAIPATTDSYYACFKIYDDEVPYAYDYGVDGYSLVDSDNNGEWANPVSFQIHDTLNLMPYIRVKMYNSSLCNNTTILVAGDVNDDIDPCDVGNCFGGITVNTVSGGTAPYSYAWSGPGGYASTDKDIDDIEEKGTYTLIVTDVNGCTSSTDFTADGNLSVNELEGVSFNMYPNPAEDVVNITFANAGSYDVTVTNIKGELMISTSLNSGQGETQSIQVNDLAAGVYLVKVANDNVSTTQEIIIK